MPQTSKKVMRFGDEIFHKTGGKGRATSVGEAVDVTYTELQDQASSKAKKLVPSMRKGQYSLSDYLHPIKYQTSGL